MHRNDKHWLTEEELEDRTFGKVLEDSVAEIHNLRLILESAFSGTELMAAAALAKELGFDRHSAFWPRSLATEETFGMAWLDEDDVVADLNPPPDAKPGWKLDPYYGDRLRYWFGDEWDILVAPAPGNLELYKRIAADEEVDELPDPPPVQPANRERTPSADPDSPR